MAGMWVLVGMVLCLATHTHGQLGEGVGEEEEGMGGQVESDSIPDNSEDDSKDDALDAKDDTVYDNNSGGGGGGVLMPVRYNTVGDTYQGCYREDNNFNDTGGVMFVNLTQVMLVHNLSNVAEGCFHMCHVSEPFTHYISVSTSTPPQADSCGCHLKEHIHHDSKVSDDSNCDVEPNLYRVYCGPMNKECYNRGSISVLSAASLITSLLITLLASHDIHLDVR